MIVTGESHVWGLAPVTSGQLVSFWGPGLDKKTIYRPTVPGCGG